MCLSAHIWSQNFRSPIEVHARAKAFAFQLSKNVAERRKFKQPYYQAADLRTVQPSKNFSDRETEWWVTNSVSKMPTTSFTFLSGFVSVLVSTATAIIKLLTLTRSNVIVEIWFKALARSIIGAHAANFIHRDWKFIPPLSLFNEARTQTVNNENLFKSSLLVHQ